MQERHVELSVGDVVQIGELLVTVIDVDGPDVSIRVDERQAEELLPDRQQAQTMPLPK